MEENNNNENQEKEAQKKRRKNITKYILKPLIKPLIIISLCLFGIFLTVGLFFAVRLSVLNLFSDLISGYNEKNLENGSASANNSVIYIDENTGYYKLKDEYSKKILQQLEDHKVNTEVMGFVPETDDDEEDEGAAGGAMDEETAKELQDMIDKYIKAEVQTTFPKTGNTWWWQNDDEIDGKIIIKRASSDGSIKYLEYEKYSDFCSLVEDKNPDNDAEALSKFSINPKDFKLCIAKENSKTIYYKDGEVIHSEGGGITKQELDYQTYLQNYSVPLNFFITLHVIAQDKAFMEEFVEMAIGGDDPEPIVLTYIDTQEENTTTYEYSGKAEKTVTTTKVKEKSDNAEENSDITIGTEPQTTQTTTTTQLDINNNNVQEYYSEAPGYDKVVTISNFGKLYITKVNTWLKSSEKQVSEMKPEDNGSGTQENEPIADLPKEFSNNTSNTVNADGVITKFVNTKITINSLKEIIDTSSISRKYTVVDVKKELAIQGFIDLIESYPKVRNNISTSPSNIFYLLQQNENTQRLEKIMRYVCYVLNDVDYGVTKADLDYLLTEETFIQVGGGTYTGSTNSEKIWFALLSEGYSKAAVAGVLGNIDMESGFESVKLEKEYKKVLGHTDESYTEVVDKGTYDRQSFISDHKDDQCGAGYGLLQWTWETRKAGLYDLAKSTGRSIGNFDLQLEYLKQELRGIKQDSVWRTTESPEEAARVLCKGFVNELADEANVKERERRARKWYDKYENYNPGMLQTNTDDSRVKAYYTSTKGRTFTILNQLEIGKGTSWSWGGKCNRAATAIIASAYKEESVDSLINTMNRQYSESDGSVIPKGFLESYGLTRTAYVQNPNLDMSVGEYSQLIRNQLQSGGYMAIWVNSVLGEYDPYDGLRRKKWTSAKSDGNYGYHWVAIIDYRMDSNGEEYIVVADYAGAEWYPIGEFYHGIDGYALISEM